MTSDLATETVLPRHIAIVMDGNGRWAQQRGQRRNSGHRAGVTATRKIVEHCGKIGIETLTLFAFSSENWKRPQAEVGMLMALFIEALGREVKELHQQNVRLEFIGDKAKLSDKLKDKMLHSETLTKGNSGLQLYVAVSYGGRWDISNAARNLARQVLDGRLQVDHIDECSLHKHMALSAVPDPDLFIRTGGEHRISNFLLWNLAYTELYFSDLLWPDFGAKQLDDAIEHFASRQRRFGTVRDPLEESG